MSRGKLWPFFGQIVNDGHLEVVSAVIAGLELPRGTTDNASNMKLLVDLVMGDLIH